MMADDQIAALPEDLRQLVLSAREEAADIERKAAKYIATVEAFIAELPEDMTEDLRVDKS